MRWKQVPSALDAPAPVDYTPSSRGPHRPWRERLGRGMRGQCRWRSGLSMGRPVERFEALLYEDLVGSLGEADRDRARTPRRQPGGTAAFAPAADACTSYASHARWCDPRTGDPRRPATMLNDARDRRLVASYLRTGQRPSANALLVEGETRGMRFGMEPPGTSLRPKGGCST